MTSVIFVQNILNGLALGSLYALVAIGYTMVYGILRLINFAHGNIFATGAYIAFVSITVLHFNWAIAYLIVITLTATLGILTDKVAYKPLRNAPRISGLVSAIAVSFIIENLLVIFFGGRPKSFPRPIFLEHIIKIGGVNIPMVNIVIIIVTAILLMALLFLLYKTKPGIAMRSLASDFDTARLMGINVDKTVAITFLIGSSMAGIGGILWALKFPQINPYMATLPGIKAFIAAVVGGIGIVQGAAVGAVGLGFAEILLVAFLPTLSGYRDAIAFILLIITLIWKPNGLMGQKGRVKV